MGTNLDLNDELLAEAEKLARQTGRTLTAVIEDALRQTLARQKQLAAKGRISLITHGMGGVHAGVNLDCTAELIDRMDGVMVLVDVNVFVYAFRQDASDHTVAATWLEEVLNHDDFFGVSEIVLSGFLRIVTNPRIFVAPSPLETALVFAEQVRSRPNCLSIVPGPAHWDIFTRLCRETGATGNLIPDAYFAALAIESNCEWISTDRDYRRFAGLQWRIPW